MSWVQRQMMEGKDPRVILNEILPSGTSIPDGVHDVMLWKIIVSILSEPPKRKKLDSVNTMNDLIELIKKCSNIIVLTGAGVSCLEDSILYMHFNLPISPSHMPHYKLKFNLDNYPNF